MDLTSINEISKSYLGTSYSQNIVAGKNNPVSFQAVLDVNMGGQGLEDRLKAQYPNLKYHVLGSSKINSSLWRRNDYPFEMFFEDELDESVLDWKPASREPSMLDAGVQARINAARGKYAIVVPPALEGKLENNPELSGSIMDKISALIKEQDSVPGSIDSFNITLDDEGNISNYRFSGGGRGGEITISQRKGQLENMVIQSLGILNIENIVDCDQFLGKNDLKGTNHVLISPAALTKMENNPVLKEKVLNDIEEFCGPENQAEIKALQPPVKSAGMIVYPDGRTLYWIEGYPNEIGSERNAKVINATVNELLQTYRNADNQITERDLSTSMQILATGYKRQSTDLY